MPILYYLTGLLVYMCLAHYLSFYFLKNKTLKSRKWDLNICCGRTDGGGVNADIMKHKEIPNFVLVKDIYHLPFKDKQFENVLCSHTIEHVDDPKGFYRELKRVGKKVVLVVPPLWDISASLLSLLNHKWIFLTFIKDHTKLPACIPYPLAKQVHKWVGQRNHIL